MQPNPFLALPLSAAFNFCMTLPLAASVGLAWHRYATKRGWRSLLAYTGPAALVGGAIPFLILLALSGSGSASFGALLILWGAMLGGFSGLFAWLIRRPDRDAPANPASTGA